MGRAVKSSKLDSHAKGDVKLQFIIHREYCSSQWTNVILIFFAALGTLPYIGNFVHIGGFFFGLFASLVFLPRINFRCQSLALYLSYKVVAFSFLVCVIVFTSVAFFLVKSSNFCRWCQYIDCVPYTEHFCPTMNADGFLNGGK